MPAVLAATTVDSCSMRSCTSLSRRWASRSRCATLPVLVAFEKWSMAFVVRLRGAGQRFEFLALRELRRPRQIALAEQDPVPVAGGIAIALGLRQRIGAAFDVFHGDERAHEAEKRIGPVRPQLGGLAK